MQVCKPCHYTLVEAVEPFKLHSMSMAYKHGRSERLLRLWIGIWLHIHTITTTDTSPDLWEFVVGRLYSVQYKGIFCMPDKVRRDICEEARPSRMNFQRDEVKIHHIIALTQDCWS